MKDLEKEKSRKRRNVKDRWKRVERLIAKFFGTVRTPLSGINSRHTGSDTLHKRLFVEVKNRKTEPIYRPMREVTVLGKKEKKIGLMVYQPPGAKDFIVCIWGKQMEEILQEFPDSRARDDSSPSVKWLSENIRVAISNAQ